MHKPELSTPPHWASIVATIALAWTRLCEKRPFKGRTSIARLAQHETIASYQCTQDKPQAYGIRVRELFPHVNCGLKLIHIPGKLRRDDASQHTNNSIICICTLIHLIDLTKDGSLDFEV